jgi:hypothetical protein
MWGLSCALLIIAAACGYWLRASLRTRGGEIPCTAGGVPMLPLLVGLGGVLAMVGVSGELIGSLHLIAAGDMAFAAFIVSVSAAAASFIMAVAAAHTNRAALVWLRLSPPNQLIVRTPQGTDTVTLEAGCVRASFVGSGVGGATFIQYFIGAGERTLNLVVPMTIRAAHVMEGAPRLAHYTGAVVQGRVKDVHRFLEPHCAKAEIR